MSSRTKGFGAAWLALAIAFGLHVVDEASHQFLKWYNPNALRLRAYLRFPFPPTFTFWPWFLGLALVTVAALLLTPLAFRRKQSLRLLAFVFSAINIVNGLMHIVVSASLQRLAPGVWSSPVLLAAAIWLFVEARHFHANAKE
jgi:hypothetical protein